MSLKRIESVSGFEFRLSGFHPLAVSPPLGFLSIPGISKRLIPTGFCGGEKRQFI
jgi:hypothetical protein